MGRSLGWFYWRVWLAERFGWSLEYVDALDLIEAFELVDICQSKDTAIAHEQRKASKARGRKPRRR